MNQQDSLAHSSLKRWYEVHRTELRIEVTESGRPLIDKLIVHIPEKHFRMIRYYGFYNPKNVDTLDHIHEILGEDRHKDYPRKTGDRVKRVSMNKLKIRTFLLGSFNRDMLCCPCGDTLWYASSDNPLKITNCLVESNPWILKCIGYALSVFPICTEQIQNVSRNNIQKTVSNKLVFVMPRTTWLFHPKKTRLVLE